MTYHEFYIEYFTEQLLSSEANRDCVENQKTSLYNSTYREFCLEMANLYDQFYKIPWADRTKHKLEIIQVMAVCLNKATTLAIMGGLNAIDIDVHSEYTNKYYVERNLFDKDNKVIAHNLFMSTYNFGITCKMFDDLEKFQKQLYYAYNYFLNSMCQFQITIEELGQAIKLKT